MALNYETVSRTVGRMRMNAPVAAEWKAEIEEDYLSRMQAMEE